MPSWRLQAANETVEPVNHSVAQDCVKNSSDRMQNEQMHMKVRFAVVCVCVYLDCAAQNDFPNYPKCASRNMLQGQHLQIIW